LQGVTIALYLTALFLRWHYPDQVRFTELQVKQGIISALICVIDKAPLIDAQT